MFRSTYKRTHERFQPAACGQTGESKQTLTAKDSPEGLGRVGPCDCGGARERGEAEPGHPVF